MTRHLARLGITHADLTTLILEFRDSLRRSTPNLLNSFKG